MTNANSLRYTHLEGLTIGAVMKTMQLNTHTIVKVLSKNIIVPRMIAATFHLIPLILIVGIKTAAGDFIVIPT